MSLPDKWGPKLGIDSKDYLFKMQQPGGFATDKLTRILGHSLTSPSQNLTDDVTYETVELRNGVIQVVSRVKRVGQETSRTYTIGLPSAIWTPVLEQSLRIGCQTNFFLIYLCPEDRIYNHWDILEDSTLKPVIEAEDVITTTADTNIVTHTTEITVTRKRRGYGLGWSPIYSAGGTVAYNDVVFKTLECAGCSGGFAQSLLAGGGDGTAIPLLTDTDNRFTDADALVTGAVATNIIDAVYTEGDFIVVAAHITAAPTVGLVRVSYDGGTTWAVVAGIVEVINDIANMDGTLILVGGDVTDGGRVFLSSDRLQTVTEVVNATIIPTNSALNGAAYDSETGKVFIVGDAGILLVGRLSGSSFTLNDISANLEGSPGDLRCVVVRYKNEVVVGGEAGLLQQTRDGGLTWTVMAIPTTAQIESVAGNRWRLVAVAGTNLFEQTALNNNAITLVPLENGATVTGDYQKVRMNIEDDFNRFVAVTDEGEVVMGVPFYPGA